MGAVGFSTGGTTAVSSAAGELTHVNPAANTEQWSVLLDWPAGSPPFVGTDLTDGGTNNAFKLEVTELVGSGSFVTVLVSDTAGDFQGGTSFLPLAEGAIIAPFSSFGLNPGMTNIDFTNVGVIRLQLNSVAGASITVGSLMIVPEPTTFITLLAFGSLMLQRRRHAA